MHTVVVDASYALACVMPDELRPADMAQVLACDLIAPLIWPLEVASAIRSGLRRSRFDLIRAKALCVHADRLDVHLIAPPASDALRYLDLALAHRLTPHDALYIDLALARRCALASRDGQLLAVASELSLPIHR